MSDSGLKGLVGSMTVMLGSMLAAMGFVKLIEKKDKEIER